MTQFRIVFRIQLRSQGLVFFTQTFPCSRFLQSERGTLDSSWRQSNAKTRQRRVCGEPAAGGVSTGGKSGQTKATNMVAAQQVSSCARTRRARISGGVRGCRRCAGSFLLLRGECPLRVLARSTRMAGGAYAKRPKLRMSTIEPTLATTRQQNRCLNVLFRRPVARLPHTDFACAWLHEALV